jgi:hypothetical protein
MIFSIQKVKVKCATQFVDLYVFSDTRESGGRGSRPAASGGSSPVLKTRLSASHPDLSSLQLLHVADSKSNQPEHCLRVFKADQMCKYLPIHKVG